ncbi:hypothetical protein HT136_07060 [Novosphingobium profundi]|uniref:hypothetical protein n=1 Tax=Novosphingobium profundi TaxID=1774954 RepID=UPI001BD96212|nr:hypothetical protein [Novosphingobium profundi]MBT0668122.1 hypothetical protein [Novosphingobium profundi]
MMGRRIVNIADAMLQSMLDLLTIAGVKFERSAKALTPAMRTWAFPRWPVFTASLLIRRM